MKVNQSLTAAITAAALVVGAGFAYAQTTATPPPTEPSAAPGTTMQQAPPSTDTSTTQAQPSTSTGTSLDSSTTQSSTMTPEPRADRN